MFFYTVAKEQSQDFIDTWNITLSLVKQGGKTWLDVVWFNIRNNHKICKRETLLKIIINKLKPLQEKTFLLFVTTGKY